MTLSSRKKCIYIMHSKVYAPRVVTYLSCAPGCFLCSLLPMLLPKRLWHRMGWLPEGWVAALCTSLEIPTWSEQKHTVETIHFKA